MNARKLQTRDELLFVLGLAPGSSDDVVKRAYKALVKIYHPDMAGGTSQKFQEVTQAYDAIMAKDFAQSMKPPPPQRASSQTNTGPLATASKSPEVQTHRPSPDIHIPFNLGETKRQETNLTSLLVLSLVIAGAIYLALAKAILYFGPTGR